MGPMGTICDVLARPLRKRAVTPRPPSMYAVAIDIQVCPLQLIEAQTSQTRAGLLCAGRRQGPAARSFVVYRSEAGPRQGFRAMQTLAWFRKGSEGEKLKMAWKTDTPLPMAEGRTVEAMSGPPLVRRGRYLALRWHIGWVGLLDIHQQQFQYQRHPLSGDTHGGSWPPVLVNE